MKSVHLVITDLFLPKDIVTEACKGLSVPALEKMLARGTSTGSEPVAGSGQTGEEGSLENLLCELFGVPRQGDAPIAAISAAFDGLPAGCWLRADPVHLSLQRNQLLLAGALPSNEEAAVFCASLNAYFTGQGMTFFAPHPQRWYVQMDALPRIRTTPLSEVLGGNVRAALPTGEDATRWHQVFNEIQMLLFAHPLNESRESRGELPINSVWFWGGGNIAGALQKNFDSMCSDEVLVEMCAAAVDIPFVGWPGQWSAEENEGRQLLVWTGLRSALQRGDLSAWREALQDFEISYAQPLWQALRSGKITQLRLDVLGGDGLWRVLLTRGDAWAFWRRAKHLAEYSAM